MAWRILFFGTAELACASLEALVRDPQFQVVAVVTQPDKPRGRDLQVQPSAVKIAALQHNIPVLQPKKARDPAFIEQIQKLNAHLAVVVAYGQILPQALLDAPRHGCINVHTSLLPKYRGAAPIQWALLSGDAETGVTIMKMDAGLDTGPILTQQRTPIERTDTGETLHDRLAAMGASLLVKTIPRLISGEIQPVPQPEGASYARKIEKADGRVDWTEPAELIERKIRTFTPWPGAFCTFEIAGKPRLIKIWRAEVAESSGIPGNVLRQDSTSLVVACGDRALQLTELQPEGRRRMSIGDFLAGHSVTRVIT